MVALRGDGSRRPVLTEEHIKMIFGNLGEIISVDTVLLADLEEQCRNPDTARIGGALLKVVCDHDVLSVG